MSSKKKASSPDVAQVIFNLLIAAARMFIRYIGRFFTHLFQNITWIFREAPGAHNDFNDYCTTNFGSAPALWVKVIVSILLLPIVLLVLVTWSAAQAI